MLDKLRKLKKNFFLRFIPFRTIGGQLDIFFFAGPTPEEVIAQYHSLIGTPYLPPYWAFGYQFSRYGFKDLGEFEIEFDI